MPVPAPSGAKHLHRDECSHRQPVRVQKEHLRQLASCDEVHHSHRRRTFGVFGDGVWGLQRCSAAQGGRVLSPRACFPAQRDPVATWTFSPVEPQGQDRQLEFGWTLWDSSRPLGPRTGRSHVTVPGISILQHWGLANTTKRDTKSSGSRCSTPLRRQPNAKRREDSCTKKRPTWSSWNSWTGRGPSVIPPSVYVMGSITHCWCVVAASIPSTPMGPSPIAEALVSQVHLRHLCIHVPELSPFVKCMPTVVARVYPRPTSSDTS